MVAPQLAVILPLESSRILGSAAIDAAGRGRTAVCSCAEVDSVSGVVRLLAGEIGFMFSAPFPWVGSVSIYLSERTHFQVSWGPLGAGPRLFLPTCGDHHG
jgi:hypothetical protein